MKSENFFSQHNFVLFQQMYSNNAVVVSGSTSLPIVSAGSLASMMQVDFPCKKIRQDVVSLLLVSQAQWNMKNLFLKMDKVRTNWCYKLPAKNLDSFYAIILVVHLVVNVSNFYRRNWKFPKIEKFNWCLNLHNNAKWSHFLSKVYSITFLCY